MAVLLWSLAPLAVIHLAARRRRHFLVFLVLLDLALAALPGRLLVAGLHLGSGVPGAAPWGLPTTVVGSPEQTDVSLQFHPWWGEVTRLVRSGEPPWITDRIGGGSPLFANAQSGLPFPLHLPVWALGPERGTDVLVIWKLVATALGGFVLLLRLRLRPGAAATGALAYALGAYSLLWVVVPLGWVVAAAPWALWLVVGTVRGRRQEAAVLALLLGALAGWSVHPETAAFLWLAAAVFGVVRGAGRWRRLRRLAAALALALPIAAVGALPALATIAESSKLAKTLAHAQYPSPQATWGMRARVAALLATPLREGHPGHGTWRLPFPMATAAFGVGAVPLVMLFASRPRRRLRRDVLALSVLGGGAAVLVWQLPGVAHALAHAPVLGQMVWVRAAFVFSLALAMLAAMATDTVLRRPRRVATLVSAALIQAVVVALLASTGEGRRAWAAAWTPAAVGAFAAALPASAGLAVPVAVAAECSLVGTSLLPARRQQIPANADTPLAALQNLAAAEGGRVLGLLDALPANSAAPAGLSDLRSHDPIRSLALARLHAAFGAGGADLPGPITVPWARLAGAWGVRWLATPASGIEGPLSVGWEEIYSGAGGRLYRNTAALAVARVATRVIAPPGDPSYGSWEGIDFATTAVAETLVPMSGSGGSMAVVESRPWRWQALVEARGTVMAALHVPYAPGWRTSLDDREVSPTIVNVAAMGVVVPDGKHLVQWKYSPPGWRSGAAITVLGMVLAVAYGRSGRRRKMRSAG